MMLEWLSQYWGTVLAAAAVAAIAAAVIVKMVADRKKGKSSCGCNCAHCAMSCACHKMQSSAQPETKQN